MLLMLEPKHSSAIETRSDMASKEKIRLLVLQPTPFCNLNCSYCYLPSREQKSRMSEDTLRVALSAIFRSGRVDERLNVVWHAGEPLVLPIEYYRRMFAIAESLTPAGVRLQHGFQSNGTLLTDAWCRFIAEKDISVGVSIDGPRALHDLYRKTRSGRGSFKATMAGIERLKSHDVPFHVITVLTRESLFFPDEMIDFYHRSGIRRIAFNIEEIEGMHRSSSLSDARIDTLFRQFFERLLEATKLFEDIEWVRELADTAGRIDFARNAQVMNTQTTPFAIVSVSHNGLFSTFSPELLGMPDLRFGDFVLGSFYTDDFDTATASPKFSRLSAEIEEGVRNCQQTCAYFPLCGGGAPANKLYEAGDFTATETLYCRLNVKVLSDLVLEALSEEAKERRVSS